MALRIGLTAQAFNFGQPLGAWGTLSYHMRGEPSSLGVKDARGLGANVSQLVRWRLGCARHLLPSL